MGVARSPQHASGSVGLSQGFQGYFDALGFPHALYCPVLRLELIATSYPPDHLTRVPCRFKPENVLLTVQDRRPGYRFDQDRRKFVHDEMGTRESLGTGFALAQVRAGLLGASDIPGCVGTGFALAQVRTGS